MNKLTTMIKAICGCAFFIFVHSLHSQSVVDVTVNNICLEESIGSIELNFDSSILSDYTLPFQSEWENLTTGDFSNFNISSLNYSIPNLQPGSYEIRIFLSDECEIFLEVEINEIESYQLNVSSQVINPTNGSEQCENGAIDLTISGGIPPYKVEWIGSWGLNYTITDLNGNDGQEDVSDKRSGSYYVKITDSNCGFYEEDFDLECEDCPSLISNINPNGFIDCEGAKGSLTVLLTEDIVPPYLIKWSNGRTTATIDDLDPGYYGVKVKDSRGCVSEQSIELFVVNETIDLVQDVDLLVDFSCVNGSTGSVEFADPNFPSLGYSYRWTGTNGFFATTQNIQGVPEGEYCVVVKDLSKPDCIYASGCVKVTDAVLPEVTLKSMRNPENCTRPITIHNCTGRLNINVPPGVSFEWLDIPNLSQSFSTSITDLCPGKEYTIQYCFDGCCREKQFKIKCCNIIAKGEEVITTEPISIEAWVRSTDGIISVNVEGGLQPIHYNWTGPDGFTANSSSINNLEIGVYCVTVFDGCSTVNECYEIINCNNVPITVTGSTSNTCIGVKTGSITLQVNGGNPPYKYYWETGHYGQQIDMLGKGEYCITITDQNGCESERTCFTILEDGEVTITRIDGTCTDRITCHDFVEDVFIGYGESVTSADCRYSQRYCKDGTEAGPPIALPRVYVRDFTTCTAQEMCNGSPIGSPIEGEMITDEIYNSESTSSSGCFECHRISYCEITTPNGVTQRKVVNSTKGEIYYHHVAGMCKSDECFLRVFCKFGVNPTVIWEGCVTKPKDFECQHYVFNYNYCDPTILINTYNTPNDNDDYSTLVSDIDSSLGKDKFNSHFQVLSNEQRSNNVIIPNPFIDKFTIILPPDFEMKSYSIYNIYGSLVKSSNEMNVLDQTHVVDSDTMTPGIYFISLVSHSGDILTSKIIKI